MQWRERPRRLRWRLILVVPVATAVTGAPALAHEPHRDDIRPPATDLAVRMTGTPAVVQTGGTATFEMSVRNVGAHHVRRVKAAIALTGGTIASVGGVGWTCRSGSTLVTCTRRSLRRGATTSLVVTTVATGGYQRIGAGGSVISRHGDATPQDNSDAAMVDVNNAPVVGDDSARTEADTPVDIWVMDNDSDPDGDQLTFSAVSTPTKGTVTCEDIGCIYTPAAGAAGAGVVTFTYTVADGRGAAASATVTVTVGEPPVPPPAPPGDDLGLQGDNGVVVSGPLSVHPGQVGGYTAIVANGCSVTARNVVVRFTLPAGAKLLSAPARAIRRGRYVIVRIGSLRLGAPRGVGVKIRFGRAGGALRTLVVAVSSSNARLAGDGVVISVR